MFRHAFRRVRTSVYDLTESVSQQTTRRLRRALDVRTLSSVSIAIRMASLTAPTRFISISSPASVEKHLGAARAASPERTACRVVSMGVGVMVGSRRRVSREVRDDGSRGETRAQEQTQTHGPTLPRTRASIGEEASVAGHEPRPAPPCTRPGAALD
jgi:hypothetical protein